MADRGGNDLVFGVHDSVPEVGGDNGAPTARRADLVISEVGEELLVYDTRTHHIHHLNAVTATIWRLCDGRRSFGSMVRDASSVRHQPSESTVRMALAKLDDANLLEEPLPAGMRGDGQSRRGFMRGVAKGTAVALPAIVSITAPTARVAASDGCHVQNGKAPLKSTQCASHLEGWCCFIDSTMTTWGECKETGPEIYTCAAG